VPEARGRTLDEFESDVVSGEIFTSDKVRAA
jgi:hypothetical protein